MLKSLWIKEKQKLQYLENIRKRRKITLKYKLLKNLWELKISVKNYIFKIFMGQKKNQ